MQKGITLIELLIVIVILGIIAAIAIPLVGKVVESAEKNALVNDIAMLSNGASLYCTIEKCEHDEVLTSAELGDYVSIQQGDTQYELTVASTNVYTIKIHQNNWFYEGDTSLATRDLILPKPDNLWD